MGTEIPAIQPVSHPNPAPPLTTRPAPEARPSLPNPPNIGVSYEVDQKTGRVIIRMIDEATQEVVREIPPEEIRQMSRAIDEMLGRMLDRQG